MEGTKTLLKRDGFILVEVAIFLVGELVKGGQSTLKIVTKNHKGTFTKTVKRVIQPHARTDRSIPQTDFWFSYGGKDYTVYDLTEKIRRAEADAEFDHRMILESPAI